MKKLIITLLLFIAFTGILHANDGSYYVSGNQLIPVTESDISVRKEILKITRKNKKQVTVSVYYEFYNPGDTKNIVVGFEAFSPDGDVDPKPKNGGHPNIYDFTVDMNEKKLPYEVAIVSDSIYYKNGRFKTLTRQEMNEAMAGNGWQSADFFYVYHFNASFASGVNVVEHTYTCDLSASVDYIYSFDYVLTAATRWANRQIDDFTLIVDMGEFQEFNIDNWAFGSPSQWTISGQGAKSSETDYTDYRVIPERKSTRTTFTMRKGEIHYHATNFRPMSELYIRSFQAGAFMSLPFNFVETPHIPYNIVDTGYTIEAADDTSRRILRNMPFARRGYVFSSPELKKYFSAQYWYKPDPTYKAIVQELPEKEQAWIFNYPN